MADSEDIYREILLQHARHPKRVGELADATGTGKCLNPLCGDKISVSLIVENNIISAIKIQPSGCSISLASASLMTDLVEGKTVDDVKKIIDSVNENFTPKVEKNTWPLELEMLSPLKRIRENTMKIPCVMISWIAIKDALKDSESSTR